MSYGQKKGRESNYQFDSRPLKIAMMYLRAGGVPHIVEIFLTKVIILLQTSPQSKVYTRSYGLLKSWGFQFQDSKLGSFETK
jgi:hypothetical protein